MSLDEAGIRQVLDGLPLGNWLEAMRLLLSDRLAARRRGELPAQALELLFCARKDVQEVQEETYRPCVDSSAHEHKERAP